MKPKVYGSVNYSSILENNMDDIAQANSLGKSYVNVIEGLAKCHPISAALCAKEVAELVKSDVSTHCYFPVDFTFLTH